MAAVEMSDVPLVEKKAGYVKVTIHEAHQLFNTACYGRMDPFVKMTLGPTVRRTETCIDGAFEPRWPNNPTFFFEVGAKKNAKYDTIKFEVISENFFCNDYIGETDVSVDQLIEEARASNGPQLAARVFLGRHNNPSVNAGWLGATIIYVPPMVIDVIEASNLNDVQLIGKQDPFVSLKMQGCLAAGDNGLRKTKVHNDGDRNPKWNESFMFNVVDPETMVQIMEEAKNVDGFSAAERKAQEPGLWLQVIDENLIVDKAIGYCYISLYQLLEAQKHRQPEWFILFRGKKEDLGQTQQGRICIRVH